MKLYDATGTIAGRLATRVAKDALLGDDVIIINSGEARITGTKEATIAKYFRLHTMGKQNKGPYLDRTPDKVLKRIIRGMLPRSKARGREALKKIKCYATRPETLNNLPALTLARATPHETITIKELCKALGGKNQ